RVVADGDRGAGVGAAIVAHGLIGEFEVFFEGQFGFDVFGLEDGVIGANGFFGRNSAFGDQAEHFDEGELVFGVVDLAAKQGDARAVPLRVVNQFEGIIGGPGAAAEDADDEVGI